MKKSAIVGIVVGIVLIGGLLTFFSNTDISEEPKSPIKIAINEWEGADVIYDGNNALIFIDGPVTVSAKVEKNYSLLIGVIVIPILVIGVVVGKKFKRATPVIIEKIEKTVETPAKKYEDNYDEKLSVYLTDQILEKLDEMHSAKIISDLKYSKLHETQAFVRENIRKNLK